MCNIQCDRIDAFNCCRGFSILILVIVVDYIRNEINSVHRTSKQRRFLMYLSNHGNKGVGVWEKRIQKIS